MKLPPSQEDINDVKNRIGNPDANNYLIALVDNRVVGWIADLFPLDNGDNGFGIYIDRNNINMGIGSKLVKEMLKNNEGKNISIEVTETNTDAIRFYERFEFKVVAKNKHYFDDNKDIYLPVVVMKNY